MELLKSSTNRISPVVTDNHGNVYISGQYSSTITFGTYTLNDLNGNIYLVKYNKSGKIQWAEQTGYNANSSCHATSLAVDSSGNVYMTGMISGTVIFGTTTLTCANSLYGFGVPFLAKYDTNGNVVWSKQGVANNPGNYNCSNSVSLDAFNNIYITGDFGDTLTFGTNKLIGNKYTGYLGNVFIVKYDNSGNVIWTRQSVTPTSQSYASSNSITIDKNGNACLTGFLNDTLIFGTDTLKGKGYSTGGDMFLIKYNTAGTLLWVTQSHNPTIGSGANPYAVITDNKQNFYIAGDFSGTFNLGSVNLSSGAGLFLLKYDSSGNILWGEQQSRGSQSATCLANDMNGHIYIGGYGAGDTLSFGGLLLHTTGTASNSFIMEVDTGGNALCGSFLRNGGNGFPGVTSDPTGRYTYLAALFFDDTLFCGPDTLISSGGNTAPYITRWENCNSTDGITPIQLSYPSISLFPNPSSGLFTIAFSGTQNVVSGRVEIYNVMGQRVESKKLKGESEEIDLTGQPNGVYFFRVISEDGGLIGDGKVVIAH